jgi:hypothetical protein
MAWLVVNKNTGKRYKNYTFQYPIQAQHFIETQLSNSVAFKIVKEDEEVGQQTVLEKFGIKL